MDRSRPLLARQRELLQRSQLIDGWTSESLAAAGRELGEDVTAACVRGWLSGRRSAPLWALQLILSQADDPLAICAVLAEPHGGRVVRDLDTDADTDPMSGACDVVGAAADALEAVRRDVADGRLDDEATLEATERLLQLAIATEGRAPLTRGPSPYTKPHRSPGPTPGTGVTASSGLPAAAPRKGPSSMGPGVALTPRCP